jgi:hypothetical protein
MAWWTVMRQVIDRGTVEIDDPARLDDVAAVGVDETAHLRSSATRSTRFATGVADLSPGRPARLLDVIEGRSAPFCRPGWPIGSRLGGPASAPPRWSRSAAMPPP